MLSIRMKRVGKKHQPSYRIVVDEKRSKLIGKFIEDLGWYNPHQKTFGLQDERIKYWLNVGAQASDTVHNLLVSKGIIEGEKISVHKKSKKKEEAKVPAKEEISIDETKAEEKTPVADSKPEAPKEVSKLEVPVVEEKKEEEPAPIEEVSKETEK